ncbi:MAG: hypothetical protein JNM60_01485 [Candidatus Competibacteraceae bacterium]|nr:hypothetical protein [Candidatus Competibacteraceae bacterium]
MAWTGVGLALLLPALAGALWVRAAWRAASPGIWPLALGYGYLLGMLAVSLLLRLQAALGYAPSATAPLLALALLALAGGGRAWRRARAGGSAPVVPERHRGEWSGQAVWQRLLFAALLAWLGWRLAGLAQEIWWRPLFPWDAWTTWTVRPRVWSELRQWVPFVDPQRWLADPGGTAYTIEAWTYPATVPLLALWPTLAFGAWNETAANLPWFGAALALGSGFYGQARYWGAMPWVALVATGALLSLPILNTHVALAGYADLWMAAAFSLAAIAFLQWLWSGERAQAALALPLALMGPLIKLEGAVWLCMFVPALLVVRLRGWRVALLSGGVAALFALWIASGGVAFTTGLGEFQLKPHLIQLPYLGRFNLGYRGVWEPVLKNFFVLANWHLFWYVALIAAAMAVPGLRAERWRRIAAVFVGSCLLMLFVLFFFTDAQYWAKEYTSINRVFLEFVPALLFWMLLVFVPPRRPGGANRRLERSEASADSERLPV